MTEKTRNRIIAIGKPLVSTLTALSIVFFSGMKSIFALAVVATLAAAATSILFGALAGLAFRAHSRRTRARPGELVVSFARLAPDRPDSAQAGGKGRALARLFQAGFPVPDGCILLPAAFAGDALADTARQALAGELARLGAGRSARFAVRSSALSEDSAQASFAGEFESVLDVAGEEGLRSAIGAVRASRSSQRVSSYAQAKGLESAAQEIAVVIQRYIAPDFAGVLFTADPLSGDLSRMRGNFVSGSGEKLVSGQVTAQEFTFDRPTGAYHGPAELALLAGALHRYAHAIEALFGGPQDIEWAAAGGKVFILQARPITTLKAYDPVTAEHNDSQKGAFLWSATNLMEASPEVLTPFTASLRYYLDTRGGPNLVVKGYPLNGIIAGRFYANVSVQVSAFARLFKNDARRAYQQISGWWGEIPAGMDIPLLPLTGEEWFCQVLPELLRSSRQFGAYRRQAPAFLAQNRARCADLVRRIQTTAAPADLAVLWHSQLFPLYRDSLFHVVAASSDLPMRVERELRALTSADDASALISNLSGLVAAPLESLGPLSGLALLQAGKINRQQYLDIYGHRGVNEGEAAWPRPSEDPAWLDRQLAAWQCAPLDLDARLAGQRAAFQAAWQRFCQAQPGKARSMQKKLQEAASLAARREQVRSEATRGMQALRAFAQRAGDLLGVGDDVFYLEIEEVLSLLAGPCQPDPRAWIGPRKERFTALRALPPYPALIRGRFDPLAWAASPNRRSDVYDESWLPAPQPASAEAQGLLAGFAGARGVVEGRVRVLRALEEADSFQPGEVLVTTMTNIGWTPLFPRAAAIVTDLGAPLSHAAIVARELGIPAVVGCGSATMRLHTGDWVQVDGGQGLVKVLQPGEAGPQGEPIHAA